MAILLICLCNLEIQLNSFLKESAEFKESRIQGDKQLQKLNASITLLRENFDDYERERKEKDQIIEHLQKSKINMKNRIEELEQSLIDRSNIPDATVF